jgi:hypothetical protein
MEQRYFKVDGGREKVGYCYPSGLEETLFKWDTYVPLVIEGLILISILIICYISCYKSPDRKNVLTNSYEVCV